MSMVVVPVSLAQRIIDLRRGGEADPMPVLLSEAADAQALSDELGLLLDLPVLRMQTLATWEPQFGRLPFNECVRRRCALLRDTSEGSADHQLIVTDPFDTDTLAWARTRKLDPGHIETLRVNSPLGEILAAALSVRLRSREIIKERVEDTGRHVVHRLERFLNTLGTIALISPLLGLLGTVFGLIEMFFAVMVSGVGDPLKMAGGIGAVLGLAQQQLPFAPRQAAVLEIGPRPLAAMVEETDVVVLLLQRLDFFRDEAVEFVEIGDEIGRQREIQGALLVKSWFGKTLSVIARSASDEAIQPANAAMQTGLLRLAQNC